MNKTFPIIAGIFGIATTVSFNLHYTCLALLFAAIAIISFAAALLVHFNKSKNAKTEKINGKEKDILLKNIRDMVSAQYSLHRKNVLAKNFDELLNKEAARGFNRPTGTFAGAISDLYVSDIGVFSKLLEDAITKVTSKINNKTLHEDLSILINEMLTKHNSDIKVLFNSFIKSYYQNTEQEHINAMNTNFTLQADTETKQRIKYLISVNNLDKIT